MKKNLKNKMLSLVVLTSTLSYANGFVAVIQSDAEKDFDTNELITSPSLDPMAIKTLSCTWGECVGAYNNDQAFYINGKGSTPIISNEVRFTETTKVFASSNYLFIEDDDIFYARGYNGYGSLGINISSTIKNVENLTQIVGLSGIIKEILPGRATIARTSNGLYFAGDNHLNGVSIDPSRTKGAEFITFQHFINSLNVTNVSMTQNSLAYVDEGKLFVIGENKDGMYGLGISRANERLSTYEEVLGLTNVQDVFINESDGGRMFIIKDGTIWAAGDTTYKMGLDIPEASVEIFRDTGFTATELNMYANRNSTYLIKNNKLYFSGSDDLSGGFSKEFALVQATKDMNVKEFIGDENDIYVLRSDGKTISVNHSGGSEEGESTESFLVTDSPFFTN